MVSFKSNNVTSGQPRSHCQVTGTSPSNFRDHRGSHSGRHEATLPVSYRSAAGLRSSSVSAPPASPASSPSSSSSVDPTVQRGCALHPRLEHPVTTSTPGMDSKKIVQATTAVVAVGSGQVRNKNNDAAGLAASVSGIRRRSGPQGLRSPAAKRPLSAPVHLQGWLHKQGSEGLMLWKKRWFVLSEYCLFYYKGPEEEKLLGSILLPSYRVTICRPEDKVNRKFAFKAEHANMRTYHFAAENRESMNQWVNALTLATLLQDPSPGRGEAVEDIELGGQPDGERSARPSVSSISSVLNQSADDSDSGFHGFLSRDDPSHASNNNSSPNSVNTASFPNLSGSNGNGNAASSNNTNNNNLKEVQQVANGWLQQSPQYGQSSSSQHQHPQYCFTEHSVSQQLQQGHSHQHQAMLHQAHQNISQVYQHKQQQQQQQQPQTHPGLIYVQAGQSTPRKFGQPIYANAPPKPRRLTDGSNEYSTPSPEPVFRRSPVSPDVTLTSKSPISDYDRNSVIYATGMSQPSQQSLRTDKSGLNYGYCQGQSTERRTPDTYGRSAKPSRPNRGNGDYEEVYGIPQLYQRPAGPVIGYTKATAPAPISIPTYAQHQQMQQQQQLHSPVTPPNVPIIRQPIAHQLPPPRPHSADFLEYEATRRPQQQNPVQNESSSSQQKRPQRPKSSLDIMNPTDATNDGYYYSEERYAAQMRQSAVYLHQTPQHHQQQRNQSLSRATAPSKLPSVHDRNNGDIRMATLPDSSCSTLRRLQREHAHQHQHNISTQTLQRHNELSNNDAKLRRSLREKVYESCSRNSMTREYESSTNWNKSVCHSNYGLTMIQSAHSGGPTKRWAEQQQQQQQQQFYRSASARLPRSRHPGALDEDDDDYGGRSSVEQETRDGERKIQQREESMKRLLEWKQRMLQSPLTRKPSGSMNRTRAQNELSNYYKQQALLDLAAHEASVTEASRHSRRKEDGHRSHIRSKSSDGRRTVTSVSRYNSYSSDDEASGSGSVIGRDPLPPRAVSTSHLAERTLTQPPAVESTLSSTLPLPRSTANHRQQHQHFPIRQSSPQEKQQDQQQTLQRLPTTTESLILRASSNGDIGTSIAQTNNNEMKNLKLLSSNNHPTQRLHSSSGHLRVIDLTEHRISSPSDNEIQVHSPIERKGICAIGLEVDRGGSGGSGNEINVRGNQRELLHKRGNVRRIVSGSPTATATPAAGRATSTATSTSTSTSTPTTTPTPTPTPTPTLTPTLTPTQIGTNDLVRVSAGELLGRTHEELVLLLIQLRRQNATLLKAMDNCHMEIEAQARLAELDTPRRLENLQKLEELKKHLMDLEKQYEKGKPLVNLVDNMVKLGSLYNRNTANETNNVTTSHNDLFKENAKNHRDRLEFNQRLQEQRLLAEERRDWNRLSPDHGQLQAKVQQLYKLDRLLQEESGTLHSLQQDKEILEKALGGLRHKLQGSRSNLIEAERYRKQQLLLERELSRVRVLLAHNSKKLEETVAENARLEQDLVVLRQKLQASRRYAGNITRDASSGTTAPLETELRRVQQLVGDLQRQRKELSVQVQQLTEKSHSLVQQIRPQSSPAPPVHHSKKRTQNSWLETDLDSGITLDHGLGSPASPSLLSSTHGKQNLESPYRRYASPTQHKKSSSPNRQHVEQQPTVQNSHNHISSLSPQLREQIQQHQLKQQLLKDQMQGKGSLMQINVSPLYVNTESRMQDTNKSNDSITSQTNGGPNLPPEYVPPPPLHPLNEETSLTNDNYRQNEDNKFAGLLHNREKQEIKTVRIVKRESERRQRDRGDRNGNIGIPLTNGGLQAPGGAKRLSDDDIAGSQKFEKAQLGKVVEEVPIVHAQSTVHLTELDDIQFQRSMSLPRGFGGQRHQPGVHHIPVAPPPRSDSMHALKTIMMRRHKVKFENYDGSSDSTLSPHLDSPTSSTQLPISLPNYSSSPYNNPSHQNYYSGQTARGSNQQQQQQRYYSPHLQYENSTLIAKSSLALSPEPVSPNNGGDVPLDRPTLGSIVNANSKSESPQLSPVFKSEAAKQIIKEMTERKVDGPRRRQVPKEKRRHYTVSSSKPVLDLEDNFSRMGMGRARDDLDMEQALRPRINAPDVVRSTLSHKELKYNESTIDQLLGTPNKIVIPERYIPEQTPELTAEEQEQRLKKADAIRKMLSETTVTAPEGTDDDVNHDKPDTLKRKVVEEKRQREHILQLNQILAKQVMEKSKMVAVKALATLPLKTESSMDEEDLSPVTPLPLYQQRENYYS
ncbi:PREDICTED: uncharacterized protein LOC106791629 isoform X4 [Polistes canadensis]|uniref:uncharacterized protein LOC106791629 isoform X4 n=1 Tax=Polistes canadensis TaxID=91411 RepID=UPI000718CD6D|nr:PREDICTED: uncharacterized protein LOC106791629 isoform X4 [Polistes canadensis]